MQPLAQCNGHTALIYRKGSAFDFLIPREVLNPGRYCFGLCAKLQRLSIHFSRKMFYCENALAGVGMNARLRSLLASLLDWRSRP